MVQKAPKARERFHDAALALFQEQGYAQTTVPEIAARAGLTERTFYRYFADKREVLFMRAGALQSYIIDSIKHAPDTATPLEMVVGALEFTDSFFEQYRADVMARHAIVTAHADLQEREMMKLKSLASGIEEALRQRGAPALIARIAAEAGIAIRKVALERWCEDAASQSFSHHVREAFHVLGTVVTEGESVTTGTGSKSPPIDSP